MRRRGHAQRVEWSLQLVHVVRGVCATVVVNWAYEASEYRSLGIIAGLISIAIPREILRHEVASFDVKARPDSCVTIWSIGKLLVGAMRRSVCTTCARDSNGEPSIVSTPFDPILHAQTYCYIPHQNLPNPFSLKDLQTVLAKPPCAYA